MLKNISKLEHFIGDKAYHFMCDHDSPLPSVKEALLQFLKFVIDLEEQAKTQQAAQQAAQANPPEVPKEEPKKSE